MTAQIETEEQAIQDNAPSTPSNTPRHPVTHLTLTQFEHDPELDPEYQNILAIESTDTLDNPIDNRDIGDPDESKTETINEIPKTQHRTQCLRRLLKLKLQRMTW